MKELNFDWLLNGSCLLSDVAMAYFTTCTANSTDIFYISFVYYLFMCRSACWRPLNSSAQKAEQQRIRSTKACWCPCWWFRGSG